MAPLGALPALLASLLLVFVADRAAAKSVPPLKQIDTAYASTQSSAGFMFDMRAKGPLVIYGLDVNMVPVPESRGKPFQRVKVYTKAGSHKKYESTDSAWKLWIDADVKSFGLNVATPIPQTEGDAKKVEPLEVGARDQRSFYISYDGPWIRYTTDVDKWFYQNEDAVIYGGGTSKRVGWRGASLSPRAFNGALHYYLSETAVDLPVALLPAQILSEEPTGAPIRTPTASPEKSPTESPTKSLSPTQSTAPTSDPTGAPTKQPTRKPTKAPTASPIAFETFTSELLTMGDKPVLMYAGAMFDLKARNDVEIQTIGFNTFLTRKLEMSLYIRDGGFGGAEDDLDGWEWRGNVTVTGQGFGKPTYLPKGSFEPVLLRAQQMMGFYLTTSEGPYLRASKTDMDQGRPHSANSDLVMYVGAGKRYPMDSGTIPARIFNGVFDYVPVDIPSPSPTISTEDLFVRNATFTPVQDTFIQKGNNQVMGRKAQLMVDGNPKRVALMKFDTGILNGDTKNRPTQVLSAKLRLYSMTTSDFGGYVSMIPDGDIDEASTTWDNSTYGEEETGTRIGEFRSVWANKAYEMDITHAFRDTIPTQFLLRISSHQKKAASYRSNVGKPDNAPQLVVTFAYDPDTNKEMARTFGSDPPTMAPTVKPWPVNAETPVNPRRTYFNYDPRGERGPRNWNRVEPDSYYRSLRRLKTSTTRNRCADGRRQSPRDLCETKDACLEFHETRNRRGDYGLGARNETIARPTAEILPNGLRLKYKERRSEWEKPFPPGADFARNGFNSGVQDLVNIDFKVRSEHRLCGKQYDAEMQLFYLHKYGNLEATSILIESDGERNRHFQKALDYFQKKFDSDERLCRKRQLRARALFANRNSDAGREGEPDVNGPANLRGSTPMDDTDSAVGDFERDVMGMGEDDSTSSQSSSSSGLYQKIYDQFVSLVHGRELQKMNYWDPLKPWDIYRSVHFWSYAGSITSPPCFEDVKWRVVDVPMKISLKQYWQLKTLMFDHVDPDTCKKTSTHYDESNARPAQPYRGGATYRCRRSDYASDMERKASGRVKGFVLEKKWWGVDNYPYITPEFDDV